MWTGKSSPSPSLRKTLDKREHHRLDRLKPGRKLKWNTAAERFKGDAAVTFTCE